MSRGGPHNGGTNLHCEEMDAALEAQPPTIVWRKDPGGILRAVSVQDPHGEQRKRGRAKKVVAKTAGEADEVAERFRNYYAENTPLLNSARRPI